MSKATLSVRLTRADIVELAKLHLDKIGLGGSVIEHASAGVWPDYGDPVEGERIPYWMPDTIEVRFDSFPLSDD